MSFPLSAFRLSRLSLTNLRAHVSAVLMLVMFLAPMVVRTAAQTSTPAAKVPQGDHFVFYRGLNGEFSCRVATPQEARELEQVVPQGLRQITHVQTDASLKGENATAENVDNLTIILRATATLDANAPAKAAFIRAAQIWEAQIKSPIT